LVAIDKDGDKLVLKVYVTSVQTGISIDLTYNGRVLLNDKVDIDPTQVYIKEITGAEDINEEEILLVLSNTAGKELIRYQPALNRKNDIPEPAKPAVEPNEVENNEQLFLTGQHLEQYRHATYSPVPYYEKALQRDPKDIRCNNALGLWYLRRGQFAKSEAYFNTAIATITQRNPNPYDTEPYYNLGLCLRYLDRTDEAYKAFYKATWGKTFKDSGFFAVAQIDMQRGDHELALEHINQAIDSNAANSKAYVIKAAAYRKLGQHEKAIAVCNQALKRDGFNLGAFYELSQSGRLLEDNAIVTLIKLSRGYGQNYIEYAIDYATAGLYNEASDLLNHAVKNQRY
jgi:tetratricopeptide (TPR) repeat protein